MDATWNSEISYWKTTEIHRCFLENGIKNLNTKQWLTINHWHGFFSSDLACKFTFKLDTIFTNCFYLERGHL